MDIDFDTVWDALMAQGGVGDVPDDKVYAHVMAKTMTRGGEVHKAGTRVICAITKRNARSVPIYEDDDWFAATGKTDVRIGGVRRTAIKWYRKSGMKKSA